MQVVYAEGAGLLLQPFVRCCSPRRRTAPDAREDKVIDLVAAEALARASGSRPDRRRARLRTTRAAIADSSTEMPSQDSGNFSSLPRRYPVVRTARVTAVQSSPTNPSHCNEYTACMP